ncbi:unnamed protein product [Phyllotreta striolata]|uniref:Alpha-soluble NSF attachment protein n=1 Tax=Phyllotreta striolata TaxID=444603 RepID=A0A9N9U0Q0_PHYSR|nr:unnamed protein product [Phyllotreta striolata]
MSQIEVKAYQLRDEAVKCVNSTSFLKQLFSKSRTHLQESVEYFKRAGNLFRTAKNWPQAATAFSDAANLSLKRNDCGEAAYSLVEAANCYKNFDRSRAIEVYLKAIDIYEKNGKVMTTAKYYQIIAEILDDELDIDEAIHYYAKAARLYRKESSFAAANKCYEKIAEHTALMQNYIEAIKIFEEIACWDMASSIHKYAAKQYFFRAAICLLCTGCDVAAKLRTYLNIHPAFEDTKEHRLIMYLHNCLQVGDAEGYERAIKKFDAVTELSQWHITMLLRAKNNMEEP